MDERQGQVVEGRCRVRGRGGRGLVPRQVRPEAFGLHHRFYLHKDGGDNFWLSAEDGCEGVAQSKQKPAFDFGGPGARNPFSIFK